MLSRVRRFGTTPWQASLDEARRLVGDAAAGVPTASSQLMREDLSLLRRHMSRLVRTRHPILKTLSTFYFQSGEAVQGKGLRPLMVLLMARACSDLRGTAASTNTRGPFVQRETSASNSHPSESPSSESPTSESLSTSSASRDMSSSDTSYSSALNLKTKALIEKLGFRPRGDIGERESEDDAFADVVLGERGITQKQAAIAAITEMIHTATLLHDDVIDEADTRRNAASINAAYGNKLAILGGDYLLSRASVGLARLQNTRAVDLLAQVIADLVEGEVMQMRAPSVASQFDLDYYLEKCKHEMQGRSTFISP